MPEPTTRIGRYLHRRKKYLKRAKRYMRHTHDVPPVLDIWGDFLTTARTKWFFRGAGFQQAKTLLISDPDIEWTIPAVVTCPPFVVATAQQNLPPYVAFAPPPFGTNHPRKELIGYFKRRVKYRGRKLNRQTKVQRMTWAAYHYWWTIGQWPHWDPQLRTPFIHDDDFVPRTAYGLTLDGQR